MDALTVRYVFFSFLKEIETFKSIEQNERSYQGYKFSDQPSPLKIRAGTARRGPICQARDLQTWVRLLIFSENHPI